MDAHEVSALLLKIKALKFNVEKPFTFASGIKSPMYIDCRMLISHPGERRRIFISLAEKIEEIAPEFIAATSSAGIPWGAWVAEELKLPMVYVRPASKDHGRGRQIEGDIKNLYRSIVVEDLVSTGKSSLNTVEALRGADFVVEDVVGIYSYGLVESQANFEKAKVRVQSLTDFNISLEVAVKMKYLTVEQAFKAREWTKDPRRWHL